MAKEWKNEGKSGKTRVKMKGKSEQKKNPIKSTYFHHGFLCEGRKCPPKIKKSKNQNNEMQ